VLENATSNPAVNIEVAYAVHTIGVSSDFMSRWSSLKWEESLSGVQESVITESTESYKEALGKLQPRATFPILRAGGQQIITETLPTGDWFFTLVGTHTGKGFKLMPAVVLGYVLYDDYSNRRHRIQFCYSLDESKKDTNCEKIRNLETE
jgi:hypothetical protein